MSNRRAYHHLILIGIVLAAPQASVICALAAEADQPADLSGAPTKTTVEQLQNTVTTLRNEVNFLKAQMQQMQAVVASGNLRPTTQPAHDIVDLVPEGSAGDPSQVQEASQSNLLTTSAGGVLSPEDRSVLDYLKTSTINVLVDGYYAYNFNQPVGRVNLLRAYDVSSNAFSLSQAAVVFERAVDPSAGRRWGTRLDLQYGQATATLQGNPSNEHRPDIYRNIFQAYGTYVLPFGNGINVDFGKWASSLGYEGNYTKDQMNYSRSYWFLFLPFYHEGFRVKYQINSKLGLNYWLINGTNQTEPTNGYKDEMFGFAVTPNTKVTWTTNYYLGQENPDAAPATDCGPVPRQPGLCFTKIEPAPKGKLHIFDTYVNWQVTPKWTFALEGDYVIQRIWATAAPGENSAPAHTWGGAGYARYSFTPKQWIAARGEYLGDNGAFFTGGLFSGVTEALKETTLTYAYNVADGLQVKTEWRRDWSNVPIFLTNKQGVYSDQQNTATLGLVWWFGRKQGAW